MCDPRLNVTYTVLPGLPNGGKHFGGLPFKYEKTRLVKFFSFPVKNKTFEIIFYACFKRIIKSLFLTNVVLETVGTPEPRKPTGKCDIHRFLRYN
jgi:hypothetical protein